MSRAKFRRNPADPFNESVKTGANSIKNMNWQFCISNQIQTIERFSFYFQSFELEHIDGIMFFLPSRSWCLEESSVHLVFWHMEHWRHEEAMHNWHFRVGFAQSLLRKQCSALDFEQDEHLRPTCWHTNRKRKNSARTQTSIGNAYNQSALSITAADQLQAIDEVTR